MNRGVIQAATLLAALVVSLAPSTGMAGDGEDGSLEIHGYGEVHYNNPELGTLSSEAGSVLDFHRFVLGWEYVFNEKLRLDGEIDFEHAATEIELEYAFIEYDLAPTVALRVGSLLVPGGPLNEVHEPPLFYSVERPYVQRYIIPTTWQENGLGVAGQARAGRGGGPA